MHTVITYGTAFAVERVVLYYQGSENMLLMSTAAAATVVLRQGRIAGRCCSCRRRCHRGRIAMSTTTADNKISNASSLFATLLLRDDDDVRQFSTRGAATATTATVNADRCHQSNTHYYSSTKKWNWRGRRSTAAAIERARELCDELRFPLGSWTLEQSKEANGILDFFVQQNRGVTSSNAQTVNASLDLLERLVREQGVSGNVAGMHHHEKGESDCCDPLYFNPLFTYWMDASLRNDNNSDNDTVVSARDLAGKLQNLSRQIPEFRYDVVTVSTILQVAIKQAPPGLAPFVAEGLLNELLVHANNNNDNNSNSSIKGGATGRVNDTKNLAPDVYSYTILLKAWTGSCLPEAHRKIEAIMQDMRSLDITPSVVSYSVLLRFWGGNGHVKKVESILDDMKRDGVKLNLTSMSQAVFCYANAGHTQKAEELLQQMINEREPGNDYHNNSISESVLNILFAYRRAIVVDFASQRPGAIQERKSQALESAEALVRKLEQSDALGAEAYDKMLGTLMDIYAHARKYDKAESLVLQMGTPNVVHYDILIKAYGKCDRADRAADVLEKLLQDDRVEPSVEVFNELIKAWAESTLPEAAEHAFGVLRLMEHDAKCLKLGIRPNVVSFNAFLKCLAESKQTDAYCSTTGVKVEAILDIMERRYLAGDKRTKPNEMSYTLAIKACLNAGDLERADAIINNLPAARRSNLQRQCAPALFATHRQTLNSSRTDGSDPCGHNEGQIGPVESTSLEA